LDDRFDAIDGAVASHLDGSHSNVAVIAEPFAGSGVLVDYADERFGAASQRVSYDTVVTDSEDLEFPNAEVVLVEGCHNLYTRQIGGYDVLDEFLATVVDRDEMFVTAWNRYAWDYLSAIRDVEHTFPVQVRIPQLDSTAVTELLVNHYGPDLPEFVQTGEGGRVKSIGFSQRPLSVGSRRLSIPMPELNLEYITSRSNSDRYSDLQAVVFEKLTYLSDGNPGVAGRLWERSVRDGEIAPAYVEEIDETLVIDDDEAFLLELVLAKGEMSIAALEDVLVNVPVQRSLGTLADKNVLSVSDGTVGLVPERLYATAEHLRGRQLIW
jgi:hypothetical protein